MQGSLKSYSLSKDVEQNSSILSDGKDLFNGVKDSCPEVLKSHAQFYLFYCVNGRINQYDNSVVEFYYDLPNSR